MFEIKTLLILIPALPLAAALLTAALGKRVLRRRSHLPTVAAVALSCLAGVILVFQVERGADRAAKDPERIGYEEVVPLGTWVEVERACEQSDFRIELTLRADPLTAVMLAMVTFISLLVTIYSIGHMRDDPGYWRFFTYVPLLVFSMTMLVSVSNFVLLYAFWEAVGLCSYLLVGFWFQKPEAAAAGKKAFLLNCVGDFGFALGIFLIWTAYGTLDFHDPLPGDTLRTWGVLGRHGLGSFETFYAGGGMTTAICLLLLLGACGKSAQFPLHVWLPDATEGPAPVSALIHSATTVAAGVYVIARCTPLFMASAGAQQVVAVVGGFTALLAALIALTQTDLRRILAYATIGQLGYVFLGLGAAALFAEPAAAAGGAEASLGVVAGTFHLLTQAFCMALLFLAAGSVIRAMGGTVDVRRLGGLRRRLPITHWTFLFGCLALAGVPVWAGFWSRNEVLAAVDQRAVFGHAQMLYRLLYVAALSAAFLTALYAFRAYFLTFWGPQRMPPEAGDHLRESPRSMTAPLVVLAVCAFAAGAVFGLTGGFADFLSHTPSIAYLSEVPGGPAAAVVPDGSAEETVWRPAVALRSTAAAAAGVVLAVLLYGVGKRTWVERLAGVMDSAGLYRLSHGRFFCDEVYDFLVVRPLKGIARLCSWVDRTVIDGLADASAAVPGLIATALRPLQNGTIQSYALAMVLGLLALIGALWMM